MNHANVHLSADELTAAASAQLILTKNNVITKAQQLLGQVSHEVQQAVVAGRLHFPVPVNNPKIAKGEQYKGLPWVMLDSPRQFSQHNVFAVRCMFWWAHPFTCCLHLAGTYKQQMEGRLLNRLALLQQQWLIYRGSDAWQHEINGHWLPAASLTARQLEQLMASQTFLKIARQWPLKEWQGAAGFFTGCYEQLAALTAP
jgi:hypothetical protein